MTNNLILLIIVLSMSSKIRVCHRCHPLAIQIIRGYLCGLRWQFIIAGKMAWWNNGSSKFRTTVRSKGKLALSFRKFQWWIGIWYLIDLKCSAQRGGVRIVVRPRWTHVEPTVNPRWTHVEPTLNPRWTHVEPTARRQPSHGLWCKIELLLFQTVFFEIWLLSTDFIFYTCVHLCNTGTSATCTYVLYLKT